MDEFRTFFAYAFLIVSILLIMGWLLGALFLPKDNSSHGLNPISSLKFWVEENPDRIETIIQYGVFAVIIMIITTTAYRILKKGDTRSFNSLSKK